MIDAIIDKIVIPLDQKGLFPGQALLEGRLAHVYHKSESHKFNQGDIIILQ